MGSANLCKAHQHHVFGAARRGVAGGPFCDWWEEDFLAIGERVLERGFGRGRVDRRRLLVGRMQRLTPRAADKWQAMVTAAADDGVTLMIVSGFRSYEYQASLIRKKINAGQRITDILCVNAAPGHSEHHTGLAVDIATPGSRPLTEEFEDSEAYRWLGANAAGFGFSMSFPRDNPLGIIYEPWHWALNEG